MKRKIALIGLDGATWKLLKPYAEDGTMPTVKRLMKEGVSGKLESTVPNMTATAWTTFATGKHPGKHGVFDFMLPTGSLSRMKFVTSGDIQDKTVYELLKEHGYTPILMNLPVTWPPKLDDEITVTSLLTQGSQFIYPESLKQEFPELAAWRLTPDESLRVKERDQEYVADLMVHMDQQMAAVKRVFQEKPWDFFFYLFSHSDWVSHLAYDKLEDGQFEEAKAVFAKIDEHLGWFMEHLPEGANLVVLSDHGFRAYRKIFYFNRWLEQEGYLKTNEAGEEFRGAVTKRAKEEDRLQAGKKKVRLGSRFFKAISAVPGGERAARWTYHNVVRKYMPINLQVNVGVDFGASRVCFPKGSYITNAYINKDWVYSDGTVSKDDYLPLRDEVVEKMQALKDQDGNPIVKRVRTRDEVYGGDAPDQAPDIFFDLDQYWLSGKFRSGSLFSDEISNHHGVYGVFMGWGPDFEKNAEVRNMKMQDIMPLVLHLMGCAVPSDCDGQVSKALFSDDSELKGKPIELGPPSKNQPGKPTEKEAISKALGSIKI